MSDVLELFGVMAAVTGGPVLAYALYALVQRFVVRGGRPAAGALSAAEHQELQELRARVARLEQSVDVVAEEVERVGEAQRFTARLLGERAGGPPAESR